MSSRNDFYEKMLGLTSVNDNGLYDDTRPTDTNPVDTAGVIDRTDRRSIFNRGIGSFAGGDVYDTSSGNSVIYRDPNQDFEGIGEASQTGISEFGAAVGRLLGTTATKIGSGVGYLAGLGYEAAKFTNPVSAVNTTLEEGNMISRAADNFVSGAFNTLEEKIKEATPIFKSEDYREGGVFQKAFTSEFWSEDVVDGLAFMLSSILPGTQISKLNLGTNLAKNVSGSLLKNATGKLGLPAIKDFAKQVDKVTLSSFMTASEAMFEAKDVKDSILDDPYLKKKYSPEMLKKVAADKAKDAFLLNMLFLAPSNVFEVSTFYNKTNIFKRTPRSRLNQGIKQMANGEFVDATKKGFFNSTAWKVGKSLVGNVLAEGLYEENIQYHIQQASKLSALSDEYNTPFFSTLSSMINNRNKMIDVGEDKERDQSILLGGLIGGGTTLAGNTRLSEKVGGDGGIVAEEKRKKQNREKYLKNLNDTFKDRTRLDIYETEPSREITLKKDENGFFIQEGTEEAKSIPEETYNSYAKSANINADTGGTGVLAGKVITKNGSPVISTSKLDTIYKEMARREELDMIHEALSSEKDRNRLSLDFVRNEKLASLAFAHFDAGLGEVLADKIDFYSEMTPEELSVFGVERDTQEEQQRRTTNLKSYFKELETLYNSIENGVVADTNSSNDLETNKKRKYVLFDRGQRILSLDKIMDDNSIAIEKAINSFGWTLENSPEQKAKVDNILDALYLRSSYLRGVTSEHSLHHPHLNRLNRNVQDAVDTLLEDFFSDGKKDYNFGGSDPNAARDFLRASLINEQLTTSREQLFNEWKDISNVSTGFKYFKKNLNKILRKYKDINVDGTIKLTKDTKLSDYLKWEAKQLRVLRIRKALEQQEALIHGKKVREMIAGDVDTDVILDYILSNQARLDPETLQAVKDILKDIQDTTDTLEAEIESLEVQLKNLNRERESFVTMGDKEEVGYIDVEIDAFTKDIDEKKKQLEEFQKNTKGPYGAGTGLEERLDNLRTEATFVLEDNELRWQLAMEYFNEYDIVKAAFNQDRDYDDLSGVDAAIATLEGISKIMNQRKKEDIEGTRSMTLARFNTAIKESLEDLQQIREEVERRLNDKQREELLHAVAKSEKQEAILEQIFPSNYFDGDAKINEIRDALIEELQQEELDLFKVSSLQQALVAYMSMKLEDSHIQVLNNLMRTTIDEIVETPAIKKQEESTNYESIRILIDSIADNTKRSVNGVLKYLAKRGKSPDGTIDYDGLPESSLYHYFKDGNLYKLSDKLDEEIRPIDDATAPTSEELQFLVEKFKTAEAIDFIKNLDPVIREKTLIAKEKEIVENLPEDSSLKIPSVQQRTAIYDIVKKTLDILNKKVPYEKFNNYVYLSGPAGSGKTNVVIRWVFKLLTQSGPEQIITAGHQEHSAKGIAESVPTDYGANLIQDITKRIVEGDFPESVKFIVIDEIGGVGVNELSEFADALHKYVADGNDAPVVITLGDPNQITKDVSSVVGIEMAHTGARLKGIHNSNLVSRLFTRFRSNNSAIVNLQNSFIDRPLQVSDIKGAISVRPEDAITKADEMTGAYVESGTNNLISILTAKVKGQKDTPQKHVIVVDSTDKIAYYEDLIKSTLGEEVLSSQQVEIQNYIDVQGRTLDNVYVDVAYDSKTFDTIMAYNQALYTATSRAVNFVYLGNSPGSSVSYSPNLNAITESNEQQLEELKNARIEELNLLESLYKDIESEEGQEATQNEEGTPRDEQAPEDVGQHGTETEESPEEVEDDVPSSTDPEVGKVESTPEDEIVEVEETVENNEPAIGTESDLPPNVDAPALPLGPTSSEEILLSEPEFAAFKEDLDKGNPGLAKIIEAGQNVAISVFRLTVPGTERRPQVVVAHKLPNGSYLRLAVLNENEVNKYPQVLNTSVVTTSNPGTIFNVDNEPTSSITGSLMAGKSSGLRYIYGRKYDKLKGFLGTLFDRWANTFFGHLVSDQNIQLDNPIKTKENLRLKIFNGKDIREFDGDMIPAKGVPYLVIKGWQRSGSTRPGKTQLIRLAPRRLSAAKDKDLLQPINEFISEVESFEKALAAAGWPIQLGDAAFSDAVKKMSNIWASQNLSDYGHKPNLIPEDDLYGVVVTNIPDVATRKDLLEHAMKIDSLVHKEWSKRKTKDGKYKRAHRGDAQKSFDKIARANLFHGLGGETIVLRDSRPVEFYSREAGKAEYKSVTTGRSLLGLESEKIKYDAPVVDALRAYEHSLKKRFPNDPNIQVGNWLPNTRMIKGRKRTVINLEELKQMFTFDPETGDNTTKQGFGLRVPLRRVDFNTDGPPTAEQMDMLETNFVGAIPPMVTVKLDGLQNTEKTTLEKNIEKTEEDRDNDIKNLDLDLDIFNLTVDVANLEDLDLGPTLSEAAINALYRKYIPENFWSAAGRWALGKLGFNVQEKGLVQMLDAISLAKKEGKALYGRYEKGAIFLYDVEGNMAYSNVFRHELMHKVVNEYLTQEEKAMVFWLAKQENPGLNSERAIQEYIANRFMQYKDAPKTFSSKLKYFFEKILRYFGFIKLYATDLNDFFDRVARGYYRTQRVKNPNISLNKTVLEEYFNSDIDLYVWSENALLSTISQFYNSNYAINKDLERGGIGVPYTFEEAKEEAYKKLVTVYKTLAGKENLNETYSKWRDAAAILKNQDVFNQMVDRLYGNQRNKIVATTETERLAKLSVVNLSNEIQDVQYEDPKARIIADIKQLLATIKKEDGSYVPFGQAYVMLIDALSGLNPAADTWEVLDFVSNKAFTSFQASDTGRSLQKFVQKLIVDTMPNPSIGYREHEWIEFKNDSELYISSDPNLKLFNYTYPEMERMNGVIKVQKATGEKQPDFLKRVYQTYLSNIPEFESRDLANQYKLFKARNDFATIVTAVTSMRERVPMVGVREYGRSGGLEYNYFPSRTSGTKAVYVSDIQSALEAHVRKEGKIAFIPSSDPKMKKETKELVINNFLKSIGYKDKLSLGDAKMVTSIYDAMKYLINSINSRINSEDIQDILSDESQFFRLLADANYLGKDTVQPSQYISGGGKRIYTKHNSSFGFEILKYLQSLAGKGFVQRIPQYLNLPYFKENIFMKGINTIHGYVDHDSIKFKGTDTSAIEYTAEGPLDWMSRNFNYAFVGHILKYQGAAKRYVQFLYPVSNKPNIPGIEVGVLSPSKIKEALTQMFKQKEMLPKLDNVANYTPEKNYFAADTVDGVFAYMNDRAEDLLDFMISNNFNLDSRIEQLYAALPFLKKDKERVNNLANHEFNQKYSEEVRNTMSVEELQEARNQFNQEFYESEEYTKALLRPLVQTFFYNFYVNSKQANNLLAGPEAFYKTGNEPYDIVKRLSVVFAPGKKGAVKDGAYLPKQSNIAVVEDLSAKVDENIDKIAEELTGEYFEPSDAQGFITPLYLKKLQKSFGLSSELDVVLKPVYFGIGADGIPRAIKFSLIVLTDELVQQYPKLGNVRDMMENGGSNVDMLVFKSGVKVGIPAKLTEIYQKDEKGKIKKDKDGRPIPLDSGEIPLQIDRDSVFQIDNEHLRMQFNPSHSPNSLTTNPSQLTYMGITSKENLGLQHKIHTLNAELISLGHKIVNRTLGLKGGKRGGGTLKAIKNIVTNAWKDLAGSETEYSLLSESDVSLNLPLLVDRVISTLTSRISRESVDFKFKGSKLVLQSEFGTYNSTAEQLKWKDKNGFTEVIIPKELAEGLGLKEGDVIGNTKLFRSMGYRLPSTGLHSAIAMKVKGFYPSPPGSRANVIIAPKQLVFTHGSDFDIDGLFVLSRSTVGDISSDGENIALGQILQGISDEFNGELVLNANSVINYSTKVKKLMLDQNGYPGGKLTLPEFLSFALDRIETELDQAYDNENSERDYTKIERLKTIREQLSIFYANSIKNEIVDTFVDMLTSTANRRIMELPITMDRLKGAKGIDEEASMLDVVAEMKGLDKKDFVDEDGNFDLEAYKKVRNEQYLYPPVDLSDVLHQMQIHYNIFSGNVLTGAGANSFKALSYIFAATKTQEWVEQSAYDKFIRSDQENFTGKKYTREEIIAKGEGSLSEGLARFSEEGVNLTDYSKETPITSKPITINGIEYKEFSYNERVEDESGNMVDHVVPVGKNAKGKTVERAYSIWESLDSLVNAAIDNVKEQILYLINLTDKTANQMFAMIGLGIPLPTVVRLLGQPAITELKYVKQIDTRVINKRIATYKEALGTLLNLDKDTSDDTINDMLSTFVLGDEGMTAAARKYNLKQPFDENYYLTQIKALEVFRNATEIGEDIFTLSNTSKILRNYPGKYAELKQTEEDILNKVSNFGVARNIVNEIEDIKDSIREEEGYVQADSKAAYMRRRLAEEKELRGIELKSRRTTFNQLMRQTHTGYATTADGWSIPNAAILSVPNFRQAMIGLVKIVRLYEQVFFKHSEVVNKFLGKVLKDLHSRSKQGKYIQLEELKNELITFLNTALSFTVDGQYVDLTIDPTLEYTNAKGRVEYGFKGWTNKLIDQLKTLKGQHEENKFLEHLQFNYDKTFKENTIVFTSDKISDPIQALIFKEHFARLSNPEFRKSGESLDTPYSQLQIDLFKYLALSRGTGFGRTSYSTLIPDAMYKAFDAKSSPLYSEILLSDDKHSDESAVLNNLYDQFLLQYLQNNPSKIYSLDNTDDRIERGEEDRLGGVYSGKYYDLKLNKLGPKYLKYYRSIYVRTFEDTEGNHYYQKIGRLSKTRYYNLNRNLIDQGYDINKVFNGTPVLPAQVPNGGLVGYGTIYNTGINPTVEYAPGTIIYIKDRTDIGASRVSAYQIIGRRPDIKNNKGVSHSYHVSLVSPVDVSKDTPSETVNTGASFNVKELETNAANNAETLGVKANTTWNSNELIDKVLEDKNVPKHLRTLLEDLKGKVPTLVSFKNFLYNKRKKSLADGTIYTNNIYLSLSTIGDNTKLARVLAHELVHLYTKQITEQGQKYELSPDSPHYKWFTGLRELYEIAKNHPYTADLIGMGHLSEYMFSDITEFIAHALTDARLQGLLEAIPMTSAKKSVWQRIIDFVKALFSKKKSRTALTSLMNLSIPRLDYETTKSLPYSNFYITSLEEARQSKDDKSLITTSAFGQRPSESEGEGPKGLDLLDSMMSGQFFSNPNKPQYLDTIMSELNKLSPRLKEDESAYVDSSNREYRRLTNLTQTAFTTSKMTDNLAEVLAENDFRNQGKGRGEIINVRGESFDFNGRVLFYERAFNTGKSKGRYAHGLIEFLLEKDEARRKQIGTGMAQEAAAKKDDQGRIVKEAFAPTTFKWIGERLGHILRKSGIRINYENDVYKPHEVDNIIPEQIVASPTLGIATRIDGLIEHPEGDLSIVDWKTGRLLSDLYTNQILKYGTAFGLNNSKLNKAKLEVMFRAVMLKELNPETNFRILSVNYLNRDSDVKVYHVEVEKFLTVIERYVQHEKSDVYEQMKEKGLFDPASYRRSANIGTNYTQKFQNKTLEEQRSLVEARLQQIALEHTPAQIKSIKSLNDEFVELTKIRAELTGIKHLNFDEEGTDLSSLTLERLTSNLKDVTNAWAVAFKEMYFKRREKWTERYRKNEESYDKLLKDVLEEYLDKKPTTRALSKALKNKVNYVPILGGLNKKELFSFMWRHYDSDGINGWHANRADTYYNEELGREVPLSAAQKAYRDHYHRSMRKTYNEAMLTKHFNQYGKKVTKAELQGLPSELHKVFMPRAVKTLNDIAEENENLGFVGKAIKHLVPKHYADFLEGSAYGDRTRGVPLRYYAGLDSELIQSGNFSWDVNTAYKNFTRNVLFKDEMDDVYAFGEGIQAYLNHPDRVDEKGKPKYPNLTKFIEDHMLLHVLRTTPDGRLTGEETKVPISKQLAESVVGKALNLKEGYMTVNTFRLGQKLKYFVSMTGMALKPVRGLFNGALIFMSNHLKAVSGSVAQALGAKNVDYTLEDVIAADIAWVDHLTHWIRGNKEGSKLWNITQKLQFLPDNYDFLINNEEQVVVKNTLFKSGTLYWFHQIFENYGSMTMLAATMKAMKVQMPDGSTKSMWELYDNQGNYTGPVRGKTVDGNELKGLDEREVQMLKRIYERVHGSYRQEERLAMELSVLGQWTLQFKKYLPTIFKTQFKGRQRDFSLGQYVLKTDGNGNPVMEDGMNVYQWEGKITEGRVRLMFNFLTNGVMSTFGLDENRFYSDDYSWDKLKPDQRQMLIEGAILFLSMVVLPWAFLDNFIDDDDENKKWAAAAYKLAEDISLGMSLGDLVRPLERPIAVLPKVLDIWDFTIQFFKEGLLSGETDSRGLPKGAYPLFRSLPLGSSIHQWNSFLHEIDDEYTVFDITRPLNER